MPGLAAVGTLTYNGYTFDGSSKVKVKRSNVRDEADRTTIYAEIDLTVEAVVATVDGSSTSNTLDAIKGALTCEGGVLTYTNSGFGNELVVNAGPIRDLKWGPKPTMLMWEPTGSHGACEIVWNVVTRIPACYTGRTSGLIALNYEATYDIDEMGDTTRTITGYYEIAQTRQNNAQPCQSRAVPDSADKYRNVVVRRPPQGFLRKQTFKISKDKSRADFTIVDRQIASPNPYPDKVTAISARHSVRVSRGAWAKNRNIITMSVTPNRGINGALAWQYFLKFVGQRKARVEQQGLRVLFSEVNLEEDIFGRVCNFRIEYYIYGKLTDIVNQSGLWSPTGGTWDAWERALQNSTFNQRGNANLIDDPSNDIILDPCGGAAPNDKTPSNFDYPLSPVPAPTLNSSTPKKENSYAVMQGGTTVYFDSPTVGHQPTQASGATSSNPNPQTPDVVDPIPLPDGLLGAIAAADPSILSNDPSGLNVAKSITGGSGPGLIPGLYPGNSVAKEIFQRRGVYRWRVYLHGNAVRVGFPIPRPSLKTIGGVGATEIAGWFRNYPVITMGKVQVYRAAWQLMYALDSAPTQPIKPNFSPVQE